jgi:hypothetical protein
MPLEQVLEQHAPLDLGEAPADAKVLSIAERQVPCAVPSDIEDDRIGPLLLARGRLPTRELVALADGDAADGVIRQGSTSRIGGTSRIDA